MIICIHCEKYKKQLSIMNSSVVTLKDFPSATLFQCIHIYRDSKLLKRDKITVLN